MLKNNKQNKLAMCVAQDVVQVNVLNALCGAGKSTWAFQHMNNTEGKRWVYVSPYLDEVGDGVNGGRIQAECPNLNFHMPCEPNKTDDFLRLITEGVNVSVTHALFNRIRPEHVELLRDKGYSIIIDETIEGVSVYKPQQVKMEDIFALISQQILIEQDNGMLIWNPMFPQLLAYSEVMELCEREELYKHKERVLIKRNCVKAIQDCNETIIMTYLFEHSTMRYLFDLLGIEWEYFYPESLRSEQELKDILYKNITILPIPQKIDKLTEGKHHAFSVNFYKNMSDDDFALVRTTLASQLKSERKRNKNVNVMWTCFKKFQDKMEGQGYTKGSLEDASIPFASKNSRASNDWVNKNFVMHTVNTFVDPNLTHYLTNNLEHFDAETFNEGYALSEAIQFIFRCCLRRNEPATVLFLSKRMKSLFEKWLNSDR